MNEAKKTAPEREAAAREICKVGNTELEFSQYGLSLRVNHTSRQGSEQARNSRR